MYNTDPVRAPISIHAPTRGATCKDRITVRFCTFQSTLPRGERRNLSRNSSPITGISIHAPTRGATHFAGNKEFYQFLFQSTLPRGERRVPVCSSLPGIPFQSTLPRGERRSSWISSPICSNFNPRSHEGSDTQSVVNKGW